MAMEKGLCENDVSFSKSDRAAAGAMVPNSCCKEVVHSLLTRLGESVSDRIPNKMKPTLPFSRLRDVCDLFVQQQSMLRNRSLSLCLILSKYGTKHLLT